jgi:hypothetical protein
VTGTVSSIKTTVDIAPSLLREAKQLAAREGTTLRALVEAGLRHVLEDRARPGGFRLRDASFQGKGLQPGFADAEWEQLRATAYEGRGG